MSIEVPSITIDEVVKGEYTVIDVRTPKEFEEFHIPGAVNVPIFSNEQRVRVGTAYKQQGPETAKEIGLELVSEKLPNLYATLKELQHKYQNKMVIHCWRGGMRSRSLVTVMNMLGLSCLQLEGGIRAFRQMVVRELEELGQSLPPFIVLEGFTDTRKTDILHKLKEEGYPVLDLEGLAGHRGSVFGNIGLREKSQKQFECDLLDELRQLKGSRYLLVEAESKRIGRVFLPDFIMEQKKNGRRIRLTYPFQKRVQTLCETYQPEKHVEEIETAVRKIKKRNHTEVQAELEEALENQQFERIVSLLLENYYDPKYQYSEEQYNTPVDNIHMDTLSDGINGVKKLIDARSSATSDLIS